MTLKYLLYVKLHKLHALSSVWRTTGAQEKTGEPELYYEEQNLETLRVYEFIQRSPKPDSPLHFVFTETLRRTSQSSQMQTPSFDML